MNNQISREKFIKLGSLAITASLVSELAFAGETLSSTIKRKNDSLLMRKLIISNDLRVENILKKSSLNPNIRLNNFRSLASEISSMSASAANSKSKHYRSKALTEKLGEHITILLNGQYNDGTLDAGGNRQSPPDTGFVLEYICAAAAVLNSDKHQELQAVREILKKFILSAGEAMVTGGVHTPNHRWVICAALASINSLYPNIRYVQRIDEWLAEGIYQNEDGHYLERSGNYSAVINRAFITMARLLNRPELLRPVFKNLTTYFYYSEPNGDLVSIDSRRQDQFQTLTITKFYLQYRYMAIHTNNPMFSDIANTIESLPDFEDRILSNALIYFMENTDLQKNLPVLRKVSHDFEKFFKTSNLVRIRHENTSITLFGGNDKPILVTSGRSSNPNLLSFRKGNAILRHMRISTSFFRMGYFRSDGISKDGNTYKLKENKEAYYYQPISEQSRKIDGDYTLSQSPDRRFWNKMDFDSRKKSNVKKQTSVVEITENNGLLNIEITIDGPKNVEVTIEMCFNKGGILTGAEPIGNDNYILKSGFGTYAIGRDTIAFGAGKNGHQHINKLESEQYGYHQGSLRSNGIHVYITGYTPFSHEMTIG